MPCRNVQFVFAHAVKECAARNVKELRGVSLVAVVLCQSKPDDGGFEDGEVHAGGWDDHVSGLRRRIAGDLDRRAFESALGLALHASG